MITLYALRWVPPFAQGLVRDLRVRWALGESGIPYRAELIGPAEQKGAAYRRMQPFGQVPAFQDGDLTLFESGSIVLHIAERCEVLMPRDAVAQARTKSWMFAALNSVEPCVANLSSIDRRPTPDGAEEQRQRALELVTSRLSALAIWLGDRDHLEDRFTAGDLLMTTVLRMLRDTNVLASFPTLVAYQQRCEARPAFGAALAAQMAAFIEHAPQANAQTS